MDAFINPGNITLAIFLVTQFAYLIWQQAKIAAEVTRHSLELAKISERGYDSALAVLQVQQRSQQDQYIGLREQLTRIEDKLDAMRK